ncbi:MarR family winged helix-turn-helix transcriptional regulator [Amniculibacterium sp. G2-70]|uniref:MarR family winged helix-turn-helix transcriptional regulator n=1 Tax=Amniculibacterium sp. G2-70 TaxID=2767188 RepID=UPI00165437A9|nr:MarR family transcriptional regulator [Amniculibacterium sp. G2-70]
MNYVLIKDVLDLVQEFEIETNNNNHFETSIEGFKNWISINNNTVVNEPDWEGKENGRSAESVINTLIVHMNRYAKSYSKSAIVGSDFSTQEDFIYLINLKAFGEMSKMDLIKKNVHEKPVGMQIINRLINQGWVEQRNSKTDKRRKVISISETGLQALENLMDKIRQATSIVTGNLLHNEKMELIRLLNKLNDFHQQIYDKNIDTENLLEEALTFKKE